MLFSILQNTKQIDINIDEIPYQILIIVFGKYLSNFFAKTSRSDAVFHFSFTFKI